MKPLFLIAVGSALLGQTLAAHGQDYYPPSLHAPVPPGGYVYDAPSAYPRTPVYVQPIPQAWGYPARGGYPYQYGYSYGYGAYPGYIPRAATPPYGFGNPNYNGYNDPYKASYGPGVREFIRWGGADFYGW